MTTTLTEPAYQRTPECPTWCERHAWEEQDVSGTVLALVGHEATLTRGDVSLMLEWYPSSTQAQGGTPLPCVNFTPEYVWLQGQSVRDFAALLVEAAEILDRG